jgi:hypothetical protein
MGVNWQRIQVFLPRKIVAELSDPESQMRDPDRTYQYLIRIFDAKKIPNPVTKHCLEIFKTGTYLLTWWSTSAEECCC